MKKHFFFLYLFVLLFISNKINAQGFTMEAITGYPFPNELTAASQGSKIAVAINEKGRRNIYVAEGPRFTLHKLTGYTVDDGQELSSVSISADGRWVIYVRGADHGAFDESVPRNPASAATIQKIQLFAIPFDGGAPVLLGDGDYPAISPNNKEVAFIKNDQVYISPLNGSSPAKSMFYARGNISSIQWSPNGLQLAFVASRGDHSFVGVFTDSASPVQWVAPSFARDQSPRWSPDGKKMVFVRRAATGGKPDSLTVAKYEPWSIYTADVATGKATQLWAAPRTLLGSVPGTQGGYNLHWAAGNIVFVSYQDGWPHLYSIPENGGQPRLLTPGNFMVEHVKLSPDKKWLVFGTNSGPDKADIERRHLARVAVDKADMEILTPGDGIETSPVITGDGEFIAMLSATAQRPSLVAVMPVEKSRPQLLGENLIPADFPSAQLVTPTTVSFKAKDGLTVHGQLFEPKGGASKKPAILFIHGGPERQMLLGWHYGDYYANTYALNQYLVSKGFVVLSVNYRLGIGYGYEFQNPAKAWIYGASEYQDIKAAGEWLAAQPQVNAKKIGVYGGSYGGFLTALALGRDSKLFAAGVDIHGEHNLLTFAPELTNAEQAPDLELAKKLIWQSSPVAWLDGWKSPVLIIHGDDDGNVPFHQSVDLIKRFEQKGVSFESLVVPDETHHWMKHSNAVKVDEAVAEFLERTLVNGQW